MSAIEDHPLRYALANELHARPFPASDAPCTVVYLAIKQGPDAADRDRELDRVHLRDLLDRHGASHPPPDATHHSAQIGRHRLKWEQHTEFVTYTAICDGVSARPFDPGDFSVFPEDWLAEAPGKRITSLAIRVEPRGDDDAAAASLADWFVPESLAAARVMDDSAIAAGDFRIDPAGHLRFAVFVSPGTSQRRIGRIIQRLCEIETYKTMSMLGFSRVSQMGGEIADLDGRLTGLTGDMAGGEVAPEETLNRLLAVSAELEGLAARSAFRFGATGAYQAIVNQRIAALREERFANRQNFSEFMMRRYEPAMRTVKSAETRLAVLSDRAMRAADLLRTRVDVDRSAQNQALLASMDRRADLQLRLQHTVEGLSVVAISYYAVSLASYLLYPAAHALEISKGTLTAAVTLPVIAAVWWSVRRIRNRLH